jgi:hypothetical protein
LSVDVAASGTGTVTVNEDISAAPTAGTLIIDGDYLAYTAKDDGAKQFTLSSSLTKTYASSTSLIAGDNKGSVLYVKGLSTALIGTSLSGDGDDDDKDHYHYPDLYSGSEGSLACCVHGHTGTHLNYMFNYSCASGVYSNVSVINCYAEDGVQRFMDASQTNNNYTLGHFSNLFTANNSAGTTSNFIFPSTITDIFSLNDTAWVPTHSLRAMISMHNISAAGIQTLKPTVILENAKGYNLLLADIDSDDSVYNFEAYNCSVAGTASATGPQYQLLTLNTEVANSLFIKNNNFYNPDDDDGNLYTINGVASDLTALNAATEGGNTELDPGWTDPANGDFSTTKLLTLGGGRTATISGFNQASTNDKVSSTDDFILRFDFTAPSYSSFMRVISGAGTYQVSFASATSITIRSFESPIAFTTSALLPDTIYSVELSRVSGQLTCKTDGDQQDVAKAWAYEFNFSTLGDDVEDMSIQSLSLENVTAGWEIAYNIDSGETVSEPADINTGLDSHTITYNNIDSDDWS